MVTCGCLLLLLLAGTATRAQVPDDAVWIDVRSPAEYAQGHLPQAHPIPWDGIQAGIAGLKLSKDAPIYLYCAVGGRAERARQTLQAMGYSNVTNVGSLEAAEALAPDR